MSDLVVVCCQVPGQLRAKTEAALSEHLAQRARVGYPSIDPTDDYAYGRTLSYYWSTCLAEGSDLAIVEPDIVIRPDVADAFLGCECEYGGFPYSWGTDVGIALGCTRFRHAFIERYPKAVQQAVETNVGWRQFDVTFQRHILVREHGAQPHICGETVEHLNPEKQLMAEASPVPLPALPAW